VFCVGVFCGSVLFTILCACVLYCTLYLFTHYSRIFVEFLHVNQQDVPA
jgi:hypothetical protein